MKKNLNNNDQDDLFEDALIHRKIGENEARVESIAQWICLTVLAVCVIALCLRYAEGGITKFVLITSCGLVWSAASAFIGYRCRYKFVELGDFEEERFRNEIQRLDTKLVKLGEIE